MGTQDQPKRQKLEEIERQGLLFKKTEGVEELTDLESTGIRARENHLLLHCNHYGFRAQVWSSKGLAFPQAKTPPIPEFWRNKKKKEKKKKKPKLGSQGQISLSFSLPLPFVFLFSLPLNSRQTTG
jgi:hypothetical protein